MKKTISLAALLCLGISFGFIISTERAHAASITVSPVDYAVSPKDAAALKGVLDMLGSVLQELETQVTSGNAPIANKTEIAATLGGIKNNLVGVRYTIRELDLAFAKRHNLASLPPFAAGEKTALGKTPLVVKDSAVVDLSSEEKTGEVASLWDAVKARRQVLAVALIVAACAAFALFRKRTPQPVPVSQRTQKPLVRKSAL